jgi:YD repeat-containing protein
MNEGTQKGTNYDEAGRVVRTTVSTSETEKVTVNLKYDKRNRLQAVALDDGTQIGLVYDAKGLWQGFSFADGGKMLFERDASGKINGFRRVAGAARQQSRHARGDALRRVGFGSPWVVDDCAEATVAAVTAAASAVAICALGTIESCAAATVSAAVAAVKAYNACKDSSAAEESAA